MFTIIWFILWWIHGFPMTITWLIWFLICLLLLDGGGSVAVANNRG